MSMREELAVSPLPLDGPLSAPATLPRLFTWLSRGEWSGLVLVRSGDVERRVYFAEGRISTAGSNDSNDTLASQLIRSGLLSEEDRSKAAGQLRSTDRGWSFGRQLVKLGLVDDAALQRAERRRVLGIAQATLALREGEYSCQAGAVAGDAMPNQALEIPRVVAEGVLMTWEAGAALEVLGGRDAVLDIIPERLSDYEATGAAEEYDMTLLRCNGARSVGEVLALSPLPESVALRFLAAVRLVDCITSTPGTRPAAPPSYDPLATLPPEEAARHAPQFVAEHDDAEDEEVEDLREDDVTDEAPVTESAPAVASAPATPSAPAVRKPAAKPEAARPDATHARPAAKRWILAAVIIVLLAGAAWVAWRGWTEVQATSDGVP